MGRYVPPDLEGTVSFNQASGKGHALGNRARKLQTEGILTVRFTVRGERVRIIGAGYWRKGKDFHEKTNRLHR